ncbi:MAG: acetolactate synthase large subunit, partial [Actinobacteria bacterium]|nr:acetolactate synthase large subunit [Actinomycetota bacterium]
IINNGSLGMVRQWQTLFYNERYSNTDLHPGRSGEMGPPRSGGVTGGVVPPGGTRRPAGTRVPDFVKLAEAYGCEGIRCEETAEVDKVIDRAMAIDDRPVVLDFIVHKDAMVWPMVAAGTSNNDIKFARGMAPDWGGQTE